MDSERSISLIYGFNILDDLAFCDKHEAVISRYSHGIMTLQNLGPDELESLAADLRSVPGWQHLLAAHPEDVAVLGEFYQRFAQHKRFMRASVEREP